MTEPITKLVIIGDVHGKTRTYKAIARNYLYSLQVGDMGFDYRHLTHSDNFDPDHHKFIGGNHDNYDFLISGKIPHYLGDFGTWEIPRENGDPLVIFYVRGGFSIDKGGREIFGPRKSWWEAEEISYGRMVEATDLYEKTKPDFVVTHECPTSIGTVIGSPDMLRSWHLPEDFSSLTSKGLQTMLDIHSPKRWVFGHHHKSLSLTRNGCDFTCLAELGVMGIDLT